MPVAPAGLPTMAEMKRLSCLRFRGAAALAASGVVLAGCIPYPVYKQLRPDAQATVRDASGRPVPGAEVTLIASTYPYGRQRTYDTQATAADGSARFESRREWRVEMLALHGAEQFFWNWCVRKPGFATQQTWHRSAKEFPAEPVFTLVAGAPSACEGDNGPVATPLGAASAAR